MKIKAFLDTNTFIYGFEFKNSNSAKILELLNEDKIEAFTNLQVIKEITNYSRANYSREEAKRH